MAASDVEIINNALIEIKEEVITARTANNKRARTADAIYDVHRKALLRRYRWNFAIKRTTLAATGIVPDFGFGAAFNLPADHIHFLGIYSASEPLQNYTSSEQQYKIEGGQVLSDGDSLEIFYIANIENTVMFDPSFDRMFILSLAKSFAYALGSSAERRAQIKLDYDEALADAKRASAFETQPEVIRSSEWLDAHDYGDYYRRLRIGPVV